MSLIFTILFWIIKAACMIVYYIGYGLFLLIIWIAELISDALSDKKELKEFLEGYTKIDDKTIADGFISNLTVLDINPKIISENYNLKNKEIVDNITTIEYKNGVIAQLFCEGVLLKSKKDYYFKGFDVKELKLSKSEQLCKCDDPRGENTTTISSPRDVLKNILTKNYRYKVHTSTRYVADKRFCKKDGTMDMRYKDHNIQVYTNRWVEFYEYKADGYCLKFRGLEILCGLNRANQILSQICTKINAPIPDVSLSRIDFNSTTPLLTEKQKEDLKSKNLTDEEIQNELSKIFSNKTIKACSLASLLVITFSFNIVLVDKKHFFN